MIKRKFGKDLVKLLICAASLASFNNAFSYVATQDIKVLYDAAGPAWKIFNPNDPGQNFADVNQAVAGLFVGAPDGNIDISQKTLTFENSNSIENGLFADYIISNGKIKIEGNQDPVMRIKSLGSGLVFLSDQTRNLTLSFSGNSNNSLKKENTTFDFNAFTLISDKTVIIPYELKGNSLTFKQGLQPQAQGVLTFLNNVEVDRISYDGLKNGMSSTFKDSLKTKTLDFKSQGKAIFIIESDASNIQVIENIIGVVSNAPDNNTKILLKGSNLNIDVNLIQSLATQNPGLFKIENSGKNKTNILVHTGGDISDLKLPSSAFGNSKFDELKVNKGSIILTDIDNVSGISKLTPSGAESFYFQNKNQDFNLDIGSNNGANFKTIKLVGKNIYSNVYANDIDIDSESLGSSNPIEVSGDKINIKAKSTISANIKAKEKLSIESSFIDSNVKFNLPENLELHSLGVMNLDPINSKEKINIKLKAKEIKVQDKTNGQILSSSSSELPNKISIAGDLSIFSQVFIGDLESANLYLGSDIGINSYILNSKKIKTDKIENKTNQIISLNLSGIEELETKSLLGIENLYLAGSDKSKSFSSINNLNLKELSLKDIKHSSSENFSVSNKLLMSNSSVHLTKDLKVQFASLEKSNIDVKLNKLEISETSGIKDSKIILSINSDKSGQIFIDKLSNGLKLEDAIKNNTILIDNSSSILDGFSYQLIKSDKILDSSFKLAIGDEVPYDGEFDINSGKAVFKLNKSKQDSILEKITVDNKGINKMVPTGLSKLVKILSRGQAPESTDLLKDQGRNLKTTLNDIALDSSTNNYAGQMVINHGHNGFNQQINNSMASSSDYQDSLRYSGWGSAGRSWYESKAENELNTTGYINNILLGFTVSNNLGSYLSAGLLGFNGQVKTEDKNNLPIHSSDISLAVVKFNLRQEIKDLVFGEINLGFAPMFTDKAKIFRRSLSDNPAKVEHKPTFYEVGFKAGLMTKVDSLSISPYLQVEYFRTDRAQSTEDYGQVKIIRDKTSSNNIYSSLGIDLSYKATNKINLMANLFIGTKNSPEIEAAYAKVDEIIINNPASKRKSDELIMNTGGMIGAGYDSGKFKLNLKGGMSKIDKASIGFISLDLEIDY